MGFMMSTHKRIDYDDLLTQFNNVNLKHLELQDSIRALKSGSTNPEFITKVEAILEKYSPKFSHADTRDSNTEDRTVAKEEHEYDILETQFNTLNMSNVELEEQLNNLRKMRQETLNE